MNLKSFFLFLIQCLFASKLLAQPSAVEQWLIKAIGDEVKKECLSCRIDVKIFNPSLLENIHQPDRVVSDHWKGQTNLVLQMGEKNQLITVDIRWFDQVIVAKELIKQGHIIASDDLRVIEKDITFLTTPYVSDRAKVIGQTVRRIFHRGQILDETQLKKPVMVKYGQPLQIQIQQGSLKIAVDGVARGSGAIGDRIPVFIPNTKTRLQGEIISQGLVRVL